MQWNQSTMYEQRVRFILEVQQGTFSFAESCRRYGISRTAGYTWSLLTYTHHTTSSALGAQKFPSAASSRISLSSVKSATARFRRPFSRSSSFRRRAPGSPSSRRTPAATGSTFAR